MSSALAQVVYNAGLQCWWATVRALGSKDPNERHAFCHWPPRDEEGTFIDPVPGDLENSVEDDHDEFHCDCAGIANAEV